VYGAQFRRTALDLGIKCWNLANGIKNLVYGTGFWCTALSFGIRCWDLLYGVEIQCTGLDLGVWR